MQQHNQDIIIEQAVAAKVIEQVELITDLDGPFEVITKQRDGIDYVAFSSLPSCLGEMYENAANVHGNADFLVYLDERYSYLDILNKAKALSAVMAQEYNITKGDKVVIAMRNYPEWIVSFMAITLLGAVAVPLNAWLSATELVEVIVHSEACLVIVDDKRFALLNESLKALLLPVLIARPSEFQPKERCLQTKITQFLQATDKENSSAGFTLPQVAGSDIATIFYTSGSTGKPKGAVSNHESILTALNTWLMLGAAAGIANNVANTPAKYPPAALMTVPLFHVTGCHTLFLLSMLIGRKTVMMPYWHPGMALELIQNERVTYFNGVPTMSIELMNHPDKDQYDLDSLLDICAGGAARAPEHVRKICQSFSSGTPSCGYGLTETNALGAVNGAVDYVAKPLSAGLPTPPIVDLVILDEHNQALAQGEVGEIAIKSLSNILGYWRDEQASQSAFHKGYFKTGDLGYLDQDGFVYIVDRIKDIIIRGGENISSLEVEKALYKHPLTLEASVFSIPDERLGELVAAVVFVSDAFSSQAQDYSAFLEQHIAKFKLPEKIWFVAERLPRLGSGKIDKRGLQRHYSAQANT